MNKILQVIFQHWETSCSCGGLEEETCRFLRVGMQTYCTNGKRSNISSRMKKINLSNPVMQASRNVHKMIT